MKKVLFLFAVLTAMVFTSCEKEDGTQLLSEFIVGGAWTYTEVDGLETMTFTGQFDTNGTYTLGVSADGLTISLDGNYSINDATDVLTLDEPDFEDDGETDVVVFNVAWTEGVEQMVWTQAGDPTNGLTWTR